MLPLLAQLAIGLGKTALDEQQKAAEQERAARHQEAQIQADIKAKRAARAGDSGYIQQAYREAGAIPTSSNAGGGKALLALGAGLMQQKLAGDAEGEGDFTSKGPQDNGEIGGGEFYQGTQPTFGEDDWSNPNRRSPGLIGGAFNRSRGF
jgi:hypothetical protein